MKILSALIAIEKARDDTHAAEQGWLSFQSSAESILRTAKGSEKLSENVFLMSLESGMSSTSRLLASATQHQLRYRVLFLDEDQHWIFSDGKDVKIGYAP